MTHTVWVMQELDAGAARTTALVGIFVKNPYA